MSNTTELQNKYQKKSSKQHVLDNPDTYIGSVEQINNKEFIFDEETNTIIQKNINIIPGLYKLFDEGIVNSRDHVIRMNQKIEKNEENCIPVSNISININPNGVIVLTNDGNGIDVAEHPEYKIWIPELIFGHMRTSTNYDKNEKKIVGGKNGFGFKLVLIWSTWGKVETVDHIRGLKYVQTFEDNLSKINKPTITKTKIKPYTKVSFKPDYERLGIPELTEDMISLFKRRVYDICAVTSKNIKVKYNDTQIPIKSFEQYINLYIGGKGETKRLYESSNERWEYAVCLTPNDEFMQVSFVNGIFTSKGGKHVEYIINQITRKLVDYINVKKKVEVKPNTIKEQLMIFVNCVVENPSFDSQTKDFMSTPVAKFGSSCNVSDGFIDKIAKMGVMNTACELTNIKSTKNAKKTDGTKNKTIRGIPKLIDANYAGTNKSNECTIIFCEGDSAKAGIVSGLNTDNRNYIGVYPMKGKLFNVRGETINKINANNEIIEIKRILGLETNKKYDENNINTLRYGKVLFMTDQDLDGSHIKGLGINLFQSLWHSLIMIDGFIGFMNTPIIKATKGNNILDFYNEVNYNSWKEENNLNNSWKIKYYKGLGTSTSKEFKKYFEDNKTVDFVYNNETSDNSIDKVFNKKRASDRKLWLGNYDRKLYINNEEQNIKYEDFIDKEMIHFSKYDCDRSIPNIMDGLKISLRKILYSAFKKNLFNEIKVAQFSGYVSEHSGYHHGEASLNGAIVGMAQNFVGSNNINLLVPNGQFGTRLQGGKDSASERYIYTYLNSITRIIYNVDDDKILEYLDDDGLLVEPIYYIPIIPMILVNGTKGIGTGFSTDIPCYNPLELINYLKNKLNNIENSIDLIPYYEGFKGTIVKISEHKYLVKGLYEVNDKYVTITELPIGIWTDDYKIYLEGLIDNKKYGIKDYDDLSTDKDVLIKITFDKKELDKLQTKIIDNECTELEKVLKVFNNISTTNMHLFDYKEHLQKYENVYNIIDSYYSRRLECYQIRKDYLIKKLNEMLKVISNKVKYINEVLDDTIDLRRKNKQQINIMLEKKSYDKVDDNFNYLIQMSMDSVSEESIKKLVEELNKLQQELEVLTNTTIEEMWIKELNILEETIIVNKKNYNNDEDNSNTKTKTKVKKTTKKSKK